MRYKIIIFDFAVVFKNNMIVKKAVFIFGPFSSQFIVTDRMLRLVLMCKKGDQMFKDVFRNEQKRFERPFLSYLR